MSVLMPRGVVRVCSKACGFKAFTLHTGYMPCTMPGCDGHLAWPSVWPHVCPRGHGADIVVDPDEGQPVPQMPPCLECKELESAR